MTQPMRAPLATLNPSADENSAVPDPVCSKDSRKAPPFPGRVFGTSMMNIANGAERSKNVGETFGKKPDGARTGTSDEREGPDELQMCADYAEEIDVCMRKNEGRFAAKVGYMAGQPDITEKMRAILIDWLVDVHLKFKLVPETLYLTVNILDRFLEKERVMRDRLQLAGITAMLIACKYEEIYPPEIRDFTHISDNAYSKSDVLGMEYKILKSLDFNLNVPSSLRFLQRYRHFLGASKQTLNFAQYLVELSLIEYKSLKYSASMRAAAALYLSDRLLNDDTLWDVKIGQRVGYCEAELKGCAKELVMIVQLSDRSSLKAVRQKFALPEFLAVSRIRIGKKKD